MAEGVVVTELEARWIIQAMDYAAFALCNERVFMEDQAVITKDEEASIEFMQHGENELAYAEKILKVRLQEFFAGTEASSSMIFPHDVDPL